MSIKQKNCHVIRIHCQKKKRRKILPRRINESFSPKIHVNKGKSSSQKLHFIFCFFMFRFIFSFTFHVPSLATECFFFIICKLPCVLGKDICVTSPLPLDFFLLLPPQATEFILSCYVPKGSERLMTFSRTFLRK